MHSCVITQVVLYYRVGSLANWLLHKDSIEPCSSLIPYNYITGQLFDAIWQCDLQPSVPPALASYASHLDMLCQVCWQPISLKHSPGHCVGCLFVQEVHSTTHAVATVRARYTMAALKRAGQSTQHDMQPKLYNTRSGRIWQYA